ncbi:hypothetical protein ACTXT7_011234 [Hymenolepis weldensis]
MWCFNYPCRFYDLKLKETGHWIFLLIVVPEEHHGIPIKPKTTSADYPYQSPQWQYFTDGTPVGEARNDDLQFVTTVKRAFLRITFLWSKILGVIYPIKATNLDPTFIEQMKIVHALFPEKFL